MKSEPFPPTKAHAAIDEGYFIVSFDKYNLSAIKKKNLRQPNQLLPDVQP